MKNLVSNWNQFNKQQYKAFNWPKADELLSALDLQAQSWDQQAYPQGEFWKYITYNQLPTMALKGPQVKEKSKHLIDQDFIHFEINNFSTLESLQAEYLPEGVRVINYSEALREDQERYIHLFQTKDKENPFNDCASSFAGMGLVVLVQEQICLEKPIKLTLNLDAMDERDLFCTYNIFINIGKGAQATVLVDILGKTFDGLANIRIDTVLNEQSRLKVYTKESAGPDSHIVYNINSSVSKESVFSSTDLTFPSRWSRHNLKVDLNGEKAEAYLRGAYLNNDKFFSDHHTIINHNVGNTYSFEDYRGILDDKARAVFNGRIVIEEKASQSNSEQINKNLMLSDKAEINTKPELQINNDDVKAVHGATVGQIDEEQKFYLLSRGYTPKQCRQTLSKAFVYGLIDQEPQFIKEFFGPEIDKCLSQMSEDDHGI